MLKYRGFEVQIAETAVGVVWLAMDERGQVFARAGSLGELGAKIDAHLGPDKESAQGSAMELSGESVDAIARRIAGLSPDPH